MESVDRRSILLTGATGNLGSFALRRLLSAGHRVIAVARSRRGVGWARERTIRSMSVFGDMTPEAMENLEVVLADVASERDMADIRVSRRIDETWHFSSSLKYMPKDRDDLVAVNVRGLQRVVALHRRHAASYSRFIYVSTAYVGGIGPTRVSESPIHPSRVSAFHNDYEATKHEAESRVLEETAKGQLNAIVFRPSIVVADTETRRMVNYTGYYLAVRLFSEMKAHLARQRSKETLRIFARPENRINLVPLDEVVRVMLAVADRRGLDSGSVFNIVNESYVTVEETVRVLSQVLDMDLRVCDPADGSARAKSPYERAIAYGMTYTAPYVTDRIEFDADRVKRELGSGCRCEMYPHHLARMTAAYVEARSAEEGSSC